MSGSARPRSRCAPPPRRCSAASQVALVAPTTVLVRQHLNTFRRRFAPFGTQIAGLSRLVTPAEAREVKQGLEDGSIDIVIGTHAVAGKGVALRPARPADHRRGAAFRHRHQGETARLRRRGARADAERDADPAHVAGGDPRAARAEPARNPAGPPPAGADRAGAVRSGPRAAGADGRKAAARPELCRRAADRGHRTDGRPAARAASRTSI